MQVDGTVATVDCSVRTERPVIGVWSVEGFVLCWMCSRCPCVATTLGHIHVHGGYSGNLDGAGHRLVAAVGIGVDDGEGELVTGNTGRSTCDSRVAGVVCQACRQTGGAVVLKSYSTMVVGNLYRCYGASLAY